MSPARRSWAPRATVAVGLALAVQAVSPARAIAQEEDGPDRGSFTLILDLGLGFQHDEWVGQTERGLAGLNLGIGGFLTDDLALLFRVSGTAGVDFGGYEQTSGVGAPALQYWLDDRFFLDAGVGLGFWSVGDVTESGLGFIVGAGCALLNSGKHNLQIAIEYAPAFTEPAAVHSLGLTVGWQLL